MKKFLILAVVAVLATGTAQAKIDLVSAAQQAQNKIDSVTQANEDAKASLEAKKKELADKQAAKKKELAEKQAAQKAEREAKAAEQKKALEDTKNSLNNLKNSFTKYFFNNKKQKGRMLFSTPLHFEKRLFRKFYTETIVISPNRISITMLCRQCWRQGKMISTSTKSIPISMAYIRTSFRGIIIF